MKILLLALCVYSKQGGIEQYLRRMIQIFREEATHDIHVISLWDTPQDFAEISPTFSFQSARSNKIRAINLFLRKLIDYKPEIIIVGHVLLIPILILARIFRPEARIFLNTYGYEVWDDPRFRKAPQWEKLIVGPLVNKVISISQFTAQKMQQSYRIPEAKFRILAPAVNTEGMVTLGEERGGKYHQPVLLSVTRLTENDWYKGVDKVLECLPVVLREFPQVTYCVIGEGALKQKYIDYARELGISEHVNFLGYVGEQDLINAYLQAYLFILPSQGEGFGIVYIEAWKHALPVIASNCDAASEIIDDGVDGFLVDPYDRQHLENRVLQLLRDPDLAQRMGWAGQNKVLTQYSNSIFRQTLFEILGED